jgi:hypothetical protein
MRAQMRKRQLKSQRRRRKKRKRRKRRKRLRKRRRNLLPKRKPLLRRKRKKNQRFLLKLKTKRLLNLRASLQRLKLPSTRPSQISRSKRPFPKHQTRRYLNSKSSMRSHLLISRKKLRSLRRPRKITSPSSPSTIPK